MATVQAKLKREMHRKLTGARLTAVRRKKPRRFDPVTAEIICGAMETICFEVATHVSLTATTPILNQSNERNATILDGKRRLAALSVGIPQFMLSSTLPVRQHSVLCGSIGGSVGG